jgi:hypothetical protein
LFSVIVISDFPLFLLQVFSKLQAPPADGI